MADAPNLKPYLSPRTLEGVKYTRRIAERDNWTDYGAQARADVDFLLSLIEDQEPEVDAATLSVTAGGIGDTAGFFLPPEPATPVKMGDVWVCSDPECHRTVEHRAATCPSGHPLLWL